MKRAVEKRRKGINREEGKRKLNEEKRERKTEENGGRRNLF